MTESTALAHNRLITVMIKNNNNNNNINNNNDDGCPWLYNEEMRSPSTTLSP